MTTKLEKILNDWILYNSNVRKLSLNSIKSYGIDLKSFCTFAFNDNTNILFATNNELSEWENKIYSIINDKKFSKKIASNAENTIKNKYTLDIFDTKIENLI